MTAYETHYTPKGSQNRAGGRWTPAEDARLRRLWDAGLTHAAIAAAMACRRNRVSDRVWRLGFPHRRLQRPQNPHIAEIGARWRAGESGGTIAKRLGITRNAVLGVVHRRQFTRKIILKQPYWPGVDARPGV